MFGGKSSGPNEIISSSGPANSPEIALKGSIMLPMIARAVADGNIGTAPFLPSPDDRFPFV